MQRWNDLSGVPDLPRSVVTIGNFDGVHSGHRAVLSRLIAEAGERDATSVAITFDPHPLVVLRPDAAPPMITALEHRLALLSDTGLDAVLVMPFSKQIAAWTPEYFVRTVLADTLHACAVVVGHDVRFGNKNSGDLQTLIDLGIEHGFDVVALDDLLGKVDGVVEPRRWSSSWIRQLLAAGDVAGAACAMGRAHRVTGEVVHGDHRGRELGFPTANLAPQSSGMIPADGVYAGRLVRPDAPDDQRSLPAAISIGTNPTFDGVGRRVEAYVLDRTDLDLYGQNVSLEFVSRLRGTERFDGVEALVTQMRADVEACHTILAGNGDTQ